jgi:phosphoglycerate dehydrogenase-like enzyme
MQMLLTEGDMTRQFPGPGIVVLLLCCAGVPATAAPPGGPDPEAVALIEALDIREAAAPVRDWPRWRKPEKVAVYLPQRLAGQGSSYREWLQPVAGDAQLVFVESAGELEVEQHDADVYIGLCDHVTPDMAQLRWVQNYAVGIDRCTDNPRLRDGEILLTNTSAIPGPGMAEHAMTLMLMLARQMPAYYRQQLQSEWQHLPGAGNQVVEVNGKTLLVVGLGGIGRQVAQRAHGLGMRVIATRNSSREGPDYVDYVGLADEVTNLAREADVVVNITPLTAATTGMFDRDFFSAMKPTAYFINIGRGKSVVTADLVNALQRGEIAGAGLDVADPEPLPPDHPLWSLPNVLITPHSSGGSDQLQRRQRILVRENLRRYTAGEPLLNVVDVQRGY